MMMTLDEVKALFNFTESCGLKNHKPKDNGDMMAFVAVVHQTSWCDLFETCMELYTIAIENKILNENGEYIRHGGINEPIDKQDDQLKVLFDKWLADESGHDEKTWPSLKEAIEQRRGNK